jgi:hypothetical protein
MSELSADLIVSMLWGFEAAKTAILMNKEVKSVKNVFIRFVFLVDSRLNSII